MRKHGSCRFDPYYKVQWYDAQQMAWRDVQRQFPSEEQARAAFVQEHSCRVMEITMQGRRPLAR